MSHRTRFLMITTAVVLFFLIGIGLEIWLIHTCGFWKTIMMGDRAGLMAISGYCE